MNNSTRRTHIWEQVNDVQLLTTIILVEAASCAQPCSVVAVRSKQEFVEADAASWLVQIAQKVMQLSSIRMLVL